MQILLGVSLLFVISACSGEKSGDCGDGYVRDAQDRCVLSDSSHSDSGGGDTGSPSQTDPTHPRLDFSAVNACTNPAEAVSYTESALEWGITEPAFNVDEHTEGGAIAQADFDLDGDLDLMFFFRMEQPVLYTRGSEGFEKSYIEASNGVSQVGMADVDGDGRIDLLLGGFTPEVLLNTVDGWRVEDFPVSSMVDDSSVTKSIHPMDIDRDGHQDAYVLMTAMDASAEAAMDVIAWGVGDGTFTIDETIVDPNWGFQKGFDAQWFDWDGDGWQDVYVVNELAHGSELPDGREQANFLLRNNAGSLELANEACKCDISMDGMGAGLGDYNRDGRPDLYVTATGKNVLLAQLEDGSYVDVGQSTGADTLDGTIETMAWWAIFADFDNDGLADVAVAEGDLWHEFSTDPIVAEMAFNVVRQTEPERFESANASGFGQMGSWRSIVAGDHNGDGVLDFVVGDVEKRPMLLLSDGCTANGWVQITAPHGSRVKVDAGGITQVGWANTASSFGAVAEPLVHFGLGAEQAVDAIRVVMPDGETVTMTERFDARRRVSVR